MKRFGISFDIVKSVTEQLEFVLGLIVEIILSNSLTVDKLNSDSNTFITLPTKQDKHDGILNLDDRLYCVLKIKDKYYVDIDIYYLKDNTDNYYIT